MKRLAVLFVSLVFLFCLPANAQDEDVQSGGKGILNAIAFKPLTQEMPIAVRPLDNSDSNLLLQREFEKALRTNGYTVSDNASLILTFEYRGEIGAWSTIGRRTILELEARGGREGGENAKAFINLYDSSRGGVLNKGRSGTSIITQSQYRLDASIDSKSNGKRLWQAWTIADLESHDGLSLTLAMVPVMVKSLGRTVKKQLFTMP